MFDDFTKWFSTELDKRFELATTDIVKEVSANYQRVTNKNLLTGQDICFLLKINKDTLYKLMRMKELKGVKVGGTWRFFETDIDEYLHRIKKKYEVG